MQCPYCKGDIPDDAVKCMHCGEWVKEKPAAPAATREEPARPNAAPPPSGMFGRTPAPPPSGMFGRVWRGGLTESDVVEGVRWYVQYRIVMAIVGAVVFLIFLFAVFIPQASKINDQFPGVGPTEISCPPGQLPGIDASGAPRCE